MTVTISMLAANGVYEKLDNAAMAAASRNEFEMRAARALRKSTYYQDFLLSGKARPFYSQEREAQFCSQCLQYSLACLDPSLAPVLMPGKEGAPIQAVRILSIFDAYIPAGATTPWAVANGYVGFVVRSLFDLGFTTLIDLSTTIPTLSQRGIDALHRPQR